MEKSWKLNVFFESLLKACGIFILAEFRNPSPDFRDA